jgi:hypothetical protein
MASLSVATTFASIENLENVPEEVKTAFADFPQPAAKSGT